MIERDPARPAPYRNHRPLEFAECLQHPARWRRCVESLLVEIEVNVPRLRRSDAGFRPALWAKPRSRHGRAPYASAANVRLVTLTLYPGVSGRRQLAA